MATVRSDISIGIGTGPFDLETTRVATDNVHPYVAWTLPQDIYQSRYAVKITCVETGAIAYATSGERIGSEGFFQFPTGIALNNNFDGLCICEVAVSVSSQIGADFEYISAPFYFVFDHDLEKLFNARKLTLTWNAATDPDHLPLGLGRYFHVQVARDPQFSDLAYENTGIPNLADAVIVFDVPDNQLVLEDDHAYFYRVRMSDGMDYGAWSLANAFHNYSNVPPVVRVVSIEPLFTKDGDYKITFTLDDSNGGDASVEFYYTGAGEIALTPVSLISAPVHIDSGTHEVIWRTMRQMSNQLYSDVVLYARATDLVNYGPQDSFPTTIDNGWIESSGGGIGSDRFTVAVQGALATRKRNDNKAVNPVNCSIGRKQFIHQWQYKPVAPSRFAWLQAYSIAPLETGTDGLYPETRFGWGAQPSQYGQTLRWPNIIARSTAINGIPEVVATRIVPTTDGKHWLFKSPLDYASNSDGWPKGSASRLINRPNCFLAGYTDASGTFYEYPDFYDWSNRPGWHAASEVYKSGDAWVQIAIVNQTHYAPCVTCGGRHWIVSTGGPPYTRLPCSNSNCVDGFDITLPYRHQDTHNPFVKNWIDVVWMKLSTWVNGGDLTAEKLYGLSIQPGRTAQSVQHVLGQQLSELDGNYIWESYTDSYGTIRKRRRLVDYTIHLDAPPLARKLSANTPAMHSIGQQSNMAAITRQPHSPNITMRAGRLSVQAVDESARSATGGYMVVPSRAKVIEPVAGVIGPKAQRFFIGENPSTHPGYHIRPVPPQAGGGFRVNGTLGRVWQTLPLSFVFLQAYWDAYNTIHWRVTGSETSRMHIQVSQQFTDGTRGPWMDVQGDNATFDAESGHWLTDPLIFHLYWNTADRSRFPAGGTYELRIRQYDIKTKSYGNYVFSPPFQILTGATNPVSVIGTEYEAWSKVVTVTIRVDDSEHDFYNLTAFRFSIDDGFTWKRINTGDIAGQITNLSSIPGENVHTFQWFAIGYDVPATNSCRLRIDCVPTGSSDSIMLPYFKWLTPVNPYADQAESRLYDILGRTQTRIFDDVTQTWSSLDPPRRIPGQLGNLQQELETIWEHPTSAASSGMYSFLTPAQDGTIVGKEWDAVHHYNRYILNDQAGYTAWLQAPFAAGETHGQAIARVTDSINELVGREVPALRQTLASAEIRIRKALMDQGFFAEDLFDGDASSGEVIETITVPANGAEFANVGNSGVRNVTRWWRFKVQSAAEGPDGVYGTDGTYAPTDTTDLECVRYKFQMDATATFDSQVHANPLRERLTNYDGNFLAVAAMQPTTSMGISNPTLAATQNGTPDQGQTTANDPGIGNNSFGVGDTANSSSVTNVGGTLKLAPGDLPGHHDDDVLPPPATAWDGDYLWRIAAYNPVTAPLTSRPRPLITATSTDPSTGLLNISYTMQAHPRLTSASIPYSTDYYGGRHPFGYQVSSAYLSAPQWVGDVAIDWISDRRAPAVDGNVSRQINSNDWTWAGKDRRRPSLFHDDDKMMYVGFVTKPDPGMAGRYRPVGLRGSMRERLCEYDVYFDSHTALAIYGTSLVKVGSIYYLYVTVQQNANSLPAIYVATSLDCDVWSDLLPTSVTIGAYPSVVHDDTGFHLFFEKPSGAQVQVWHCLSSDGTTFDSPIALTSETTGAGAPAAIMLNGAWLLYYTAGTDIVSVAGSTPTSLSERQIERSQFVEDEVTFNPMQPCVFLDHYKGNNEVFLAYTASNTSDSQDNRIRVARLEDRVWVDGIYDKLFGTTGNLIDVPSTLDGVARHCAVDAVAHGAPDGNANVKVRLDFTLFAPEKVVYHRQSDWVSIANKDETGSFLEPAAFTYNKLLDNFPYMGDT